MIDCILTLLLLKALHKNALTTKIIVGLNIDREHLISYRIVPSKREKKEKKKGRKRGEEKVTHASDLDLDLLLTLIQVVR